jgi:hypothetical protein
MKKIAFAVPCLFFFALAAPALSHGGGLDRYGCHTVRATGEYHCHRGSAASPPVPSRTQSAAPVRQPVCRDVASSTTSVSLFKTSTNGNKTLWIQQSNVLKTSGSARLVGEPGTLTTYRVQGVQVRHFANSASSRNRFSFDGSPWIDASNISQSGNTQIIALNTNSLSLHSQETTTSVTSRRACN